jgi:hypothetical protein
LSIEIEKAVLEKACKEMIETILLCLPNAFKGTIYRIGKPPHLIAERITSGVNEDGENEISWGLPAKSDYNPPGKPWVEYRDAPGRPLEAMSWCVEKQKSWTVEDPSHDIRSVRLQSKAALEDCHHMEPVLVRKSDLNLDMYSTIEYPKDYEGNGIWRDSDYVVVAVIKIHFNPQTIKIQDHGTRVIKKLSHSLGTELLSYQLSKDSVKAMQGLARDRLQACNLLADSLRNSITKSGLIFSLVKQEMGYLREQWEQILIEEQDGENSKVEGIEKLNAILLEMEDADEGIRRVLAKAHNKFLELSLPPKQGEKWVSMQIEERWKELLHKSPQDNELRKLIWQVIDTLKRSLHFGQDPSIIAHYDKIPGELRSEWIDLIYRESESFDASVLDRLIKVLGNPAIDIPSRKRSRKTLILLKALAETMNNLERDTNSLLQQILNGDGDRGVFEILNNFTATYERRSSS